MYTTFQLNSTSMVQTQRALRTNPLRLPAVASLLRAIAHFCLSSDETTAIRDAHIQKHHIPFSLY
jgi:hypothetical protein